jgi:hypothetical protein
MINLKMTIFLGGLFGFATLTTIALAGHGQEVGEEITVAQATPAWAGEELEAGFDEQASSEGLQQQQRRQRPNGARRGQARLQRITQQLGLSEEQAGLLTSARESIQTEVQALRAEMQSLRTAAQSIRERGDAGTSEVHSMIDRRAELATEMRHLRVDAMMPFQQSLSPEQRELWQQQMRQRRSRQGNGRRGRGQNRQRQQGGADQSNNE